MGAAPNETRPPNASEHLCAMIEAARAAGRGLLDAAQRRSFTVTEKTAGDFVSDADLEAERVIAAHLRGAYPDYGWLGEESGGQGDNPLRWVVDPLDGTTNYLKGWPHWAVSIALCDGEDILCSVIHDPAKNETFTAEAGHGAFLNGQAIKVSPTSDMQAALFGTGVPAGGRSTYLPHCLRDLQNLMPLCAGIRRGGAAALDLAYVASGRLEGYWERNLGAWDIAAGVLLVREAGGRVDPLWASKTLLGSGSFLASNGTLHNAVLETLDRTEVAHV